jgi:hypothetical protein
MTFSQHIARIRQAKATADEAGQAILPGYPAAEASISIVWEALFDHLCAATATDYDAEALGKITSAIQRLISSSASLATLEEKQFERLDAATTPDTAPSRLSPETLRRIEAELSLL